LYRYTVEFDGPTHYYNDVEQSHQLALCRRLGVAFDLSKFHRENSNSRTRTAKTELRDFLLAKQCAKVVTVPYFEFDAKRPATMTEREAYVQRMLDGIAPYRRALPRGAAKVDNEEEDVTASTASPFSTSSEAASFSAAAAAAFSAFAASEAATPPLDDEAGTLLYQWIAALPKVGLYKLNSVYPSIA
jgi:hypothetical protein